MVGVSDHAHFLPLIIPIIVARLGTPDITEPSEEIRYCGRGYLIIIWVWFVGSYS